MSRLLPLLSPGSFDRPRCHRQ